MDITLIPSKLNGTIQAQLNVTNSLLHAVCQALALHQVRIGAASPAGANASLAADFIHRKDLWSEDTEAIISCVITQGLWIWNDYFYPMVFISKKAQYSLPVGMLQFLGDKENPAQWNILFAACVLCALPLIIVFLALQKQFVNGIAAGAVKG